MIASIRYTSGATLYARVVRPSDGWYWDFVLGGTSLSAWVSSETANVKVYLTEQSDPELESRYSASLALPVFGFDVTVEYIDQTLNEVVGEETIYAPFSPSVPDVTPPQPTTTPASFDEPTPKPGIGAVWPVNCMKDSWGHLEPLLTPDMLKARHLFGIPLVSYMKDPETGQRQRMTDPLLKDIIERQVPLAELELRMEIMPRQYSKKLPFDRQAYASLGYMMLPDHPVQSLDKLAVTASNGDDLYLVPPDWVETAYIHTGQINIIPMTIAFQYGGFFVPSNSPNGGSAFLAILGQNPWIPAYWQVTYTTGFPEGLLPQPVNELIGVMAAIEALALLATTNARNSSHSIGVDGLSQSISTPGPQIYDTRITLLTDQKDRLIRKLRSMFQTNLFTGAL